MSYKKGEVVIVRYLNSDLVTYKRRPALVIQDEGVETGLGQRLVAQISSNLDRRAGESRVFIGKATRAGRQMGIVADSVIMADGIVTVVPREIERTIGQCPVMPQVDEALRAILGLRTTQ